MDAPPNSSQQREDGLRILARLIAASLLKARSAKGLLAFEEEVIADASGTLRPREQREAS
jgi:hypothetical protein